MRSGIEIATLPGDRTSFVDEDPPASVHTYKVAGTVAGTTGFAASVTIATFVARGSFLRGDSNRDGNVDIGDAVTSLSLLFLEAKPFACEDDADDDGELSITDPISTLGFLFLGTTNLPPPGALFPWFDATDDLLDCED